jgi:hypothetical protein
MSWASKTAPARFGGRYARCEKRLQPVFAVVLAVLRSDPTRFDRHFGSTTHPIVRQMLGFIMGIDFLILLRYCLWMYPSIIFMASSL